MHVLYKQGVPMKPFDRVYYSLYINVYSHYTNMPEP